MRRRAASIGAATPGARLPEPRSRDELFPLAETLNEMLARLEAAVEHERRFVDDASHELRTPLALLQAELELALRRPRSKQELERALYSAAEEADRLGRLAEDLLLVARYDQGLLPLRREFLDAADSLLERVALRFDPLAALPNTRFESRTRAAPSWTATRRGSSKRWTTSSRTARPRRRDGLPLGRARERPRRAARDRRGRRYARPVRAAGVRPLQPCREARGSGGTGLGLAIVDLVARAHGGEAHLANRPGGGVDAWISIAAALRNP